MAALRGGTSFGLERVPKALEKGCWGSGKGQQAGALQLEAQNPRAWLQGPVWLAGGGKGVSGEETWESWMEIGRAHV